MRTGSNASTLWPKSSVGWIWFGGHAKNPYHLVNRMWSWGRDAVTNRTREQLSREILTWTTNTALSSGACRYFCFSASTSICFISIFCRLSESMRTFVKWGLLHSEFKSFWLDLVHRMSSFLAAVTWLLLPQMCRRWKWTRQLLFSNRSWSRYVSRSPGQSSLSPAVRRRQFLLLCLRVVRKVLLPLHLVASVHFWRDSHISCDVSHSLEWKSPPIYLTISSWQIMET